MPRSGLAAGARLTAGSSLHPLDRPHWIFDMDGTLTRAVHDFDAIRTELGLPPGRLILEAVAEKPERERAELFERLDAIELDLARRAEPQPGADALLRALVERGARLGILTRNSRRNAHETLRAAGLGHFFAADDVFGRDEAPPKPSPEGVLALARRFGGDASTAVMVGDYRLDLLCGRSAGAITVYLDPSGQFEFAELADHRIRRLDELLRDPLPEHPVGRAGGGRPPPGG